jgi:hypothetical protein
MTFLEKSVIRRGHPRHMIVAVIGTLWAVYFVWQHNWIAALVTTALSVVFGGLVTWHIPEERLAETVWGKMMILHLHPLNVIVQTGGFVFMVYGIWLHSAVYTMIGVSLIFAGHLWGWNKVSNAL